MPLVTLPVYHMRNMDALLDACDATPVHEGVLFKLWDGDAPDVRVEMKGTFGHQGDLRWLDAQTRSGCDVWAPLRAFITRFGEPATLLISRPPDDDQLPEEAIEIYSNRWCRVEVSW